MSREREIYNSKKSFKYAICSINSLIPYPPRRIAPPPSPLHFAVDDDDEENDGGDDDDYVDDGVDVRAGILHRHDPRVFLFLLRRRHRRHPLRLNRSLPRSIPATPVAGVGTSAPSRPPCVPSRTASSRGNSRA